MVESFEKGALGSAVSSHDRVIGNRTQNVLFPIGREHDRHTVALWCVIDRLWHHGVCDRQTVTV